MPARPRPAIPRVALLACTVALVAACVGPFAGAPTPIPASAETKTETRAVNPFTSVAIDGPFNLILAAGAAVDVKVEGPSNVLQLVRTAVNGSELAVTVDAPGYTSTKAVTVRVTSPRVTSASLSGGAGGTIEAMAESLALTIADDGVVQGIGTVKELTLAATGNAQAQLGDLAADTVAIAIAGGSKVTIHPVKQLTGTADGGSVVTLTSKPTAQSVTVSGGAKIVGP